MDEATIPTTLQEHIRADLPGRFNELDVLRREWPRFAASQAGQVLPPYEVLIHPSSGCNLRCQWCIGDHVPLELWDDRRERLQLLDASKQAPARLPDVLADPEAMLKLAHDLVAYRKVGTYRSGGTYRSAEFGIRNVSFSGLIGEPLVARRALTPAISYLVNHGLRVGLFTNGVLMNEQVIDVLLGAAYVHLSLDAATAETYAALKFSGHDAGREKFDQAVANLRHLLERRAETGSKLEVNVSFVVYPENYHELYDGAVLVKDLGADRLRLKRDISGDKLLDHDQTAAAERLVLRIRDELVDETFAILEIHKLDYLGDLTRTFSVCQITDLMAAVGSDGHLYPCNYHPRPGGASYGSAVETSFQQIWEGERRARLRTQLPSICPSVCDPFKNRANRMLATAGGIIDAHGIDHLERDVAELVTAQAYDTRHGATE